MHTYCIQNQTQVFIFMKMCKQPLKKKKNPVQTDMDFLNYSIKLTLQTEIMFWDPHFKNTLSSLCSRKTKPCLLPLSIYPLME